MIIRHKSFIIFRPLLAAFAVLTLASCSSFFYQPSKDTFFILDPQRVYFEEIHIDTPDGTRLHGWYFPSQTQNADNTKGKLRPSNGLVVQFHGNGQNLTAHFLSYAWIMNEGYDFFTFDYRGYGESTGKPSQEGLHQDALNILDWATQRSSKIIAVGQSLGGAVLARAIPDFKKRQNIKAVVIDSSFYSYQAIAVDVLSRGWITWPFQWLGSIWISDQYSPERYYSDLSPIPLLVIHGAQDKVIPYSFGEKIFELAQEPKAMLKVEGGDHIDAMSTQKHGKQYQQKLLDWIKSIK